MGTAECCLLRVALQHQWEEPNGGSHLLQATRLERSGKPVNGFPVGIFKGQRPLNLKYDRFPKALPSGTFTFLYNLVFRPNSPPDCLAYLPEVLNASCRGALILQHKTKRAVRGFAPNNPTILEKIE